MKIRIPNYLAQSLNGSGFWIDAALIAWLMALAGMVVRFSCGGARRVYAFNDYMFAGLHWMRAEYLYANWRGFIYSPVTAAFFVPFSCLPPALAYSLWLLVNSVALVGGLAALVKSNLFPGFNKQCLGIAYLLLLPVALGNLDVGQSNPLVVGLLMFAIAAVRVERWNIAAVCVAIPTFFKIYPLVMGMLICVVSPPRFVWRLLLALLVLAVAPFLFQHWFYVSDQYHAWIQMRISDNRIHYPEKYAPADLWFLLHWVGRLPIQPWFYSLIQAGTGAATALFCLWGIWKRWKIERVLIGLFFFGSVWMPLCGPATESNTYLLMVPALIVALTNSLHERQPTALCALLALAFALQLVSHTYPALALLDLKQRWVFSTRPLSALLFLIYSVFWLLNNSFWPEARRVLLTGA